MESRIDTSSEQVNNYPPQKQAKRMPDACIQQERQTENHLRLDTTSSNGALIDSDLNGREHSK